MYILRENEGPIFKSFETSFISALLGPRRVGKTTLVQHFILTYPARLWVQLNMDIREQRTQITEGKLSLLIEQEALQKIGGEQKIWVAIDEAQKCPALFDQVKLLYDQFKDQNKIKFILTGSAHLNLHQLTAETLAGRVDILSLREFNLKEITRLSNKNFSFESSGAFELIFKQDSFESMDTLCSTLSPFEKKFSKALDECLIWGGLPEVHENESSSERLKYLSNYLQTYLENDIREVVQIADLSLYENLMRVMAEQTGSIRDDKKVLQALRCARNTLLKYQGYLSATWQYTELEPFIGNTLRRLVKSPKSYLKNNGLISYFTDFTDLNKLNQTGLIGHRFENWFLNELSSFLDSMSGYHKVYFWRTHAGQEVDFVVQYGQRIIPFEVTYSPQIVPKKIRNLSSFLSEYPSTSYAIYLYRGRLHYDKEKRILFLPAWIV